MNYIHETILKDLIDLGADMKDSNIINTFMTQNRPIKSITSASANLTLVFPVLCTKNTDINNASMIAKATERKAAIMLQLLFAAKQTHNKDDIYDYLKQFHSNLKIDNKLTVDGVLDIMDKVVKEAAFPKYDQTDLVEAVKKDMRNINYTLEENINEKSILDYYVKPGKVTYGNKNSVIIRETTDKEKRDAMYASKRDAREDEKMQLNRMDAVRRDKKLAMDVSSHKPNLLDKLVKTASNIKNIYARSMLDTDVKKANELVPTLMSVNIIVDNGKGQPYPLTFIIGIKAKLYTVSSMDIVDRLVAKNKDTNILNKFIRATTREISFLKDFLFAIDQTKIDALSQSRRGSSSKFWKILERRSKKSKLRRTLGMKNDALAITTLVITQDEVEYTKKEYNIDLEKPNVIRPIMEAYNLMGFCILDEANEVAKFIYDTGEDVYEDVAFTSLERETADTGYKKAINLITKLTR